MLPVVRGFAVRQQTACMQSRNISTKIDVQVLFSGRLTASPSHACKFKEPLLTYRAGTAVSTQTQETLWDTHSRRSTQPRAYASGPANRKMLPKTRRDVALPRMNR